MPAETGQDVALLIGPAPCWRLVRITLTSVCWISAPRLVRLSPQFFPLAAAGLIACSARQFVACTPGDLQERQQVVLLVCEVHEQPVELRLDTVGLAVQGILAFLWSLDDDLAADSEHVEDQPAQRVRNLRLLGHGVGDQLTSPRQQVRSYLRPGAIRYALTSSHD